MSAATLSRSSSREEDLQLSEDNQQQHQQVLLQLFKSNVIFEKLIREKDFVHSFTDYLKKMKTSESFEFIQAANTFKKLKNDFLRYEYSKKILKDFFSLSSPKELNIASETKSSLTKRFQTACSEKNCPTTLFDDVADAVLIDIKLDSFTRFLDSEAFQNYFCSKTKTDVQFLNKYMAVTEYTAKKLAAAPLQPKNTSASSTPYLEDQVSPTTSQSSSSASSFSSSYGNLLAVSGISRTHTPSPSHLPPAAPQLPPLLSISEKRKTLADLEYDDVLADIRNVSVDEDGLLASPMDEKPSTPLHASFTLMVALSPSSATKHRARIPSFKLRSIASFDKSSSNPAAYTISLGLPIAPSSPSSTTQSTSSSEDVEVADRNDISRLLSNHKFVEVADKLWCFDEAAHNYHIEFEFFAGYSRVLQMVQANDKIFMASLLAASRSNHHTSPVVEAYSTSSPDLKLSKRQRSWSNASLKYRDLVSPRTPVDEEQKKYVQLSHQTCAEEANVRMILTEQQITLCFDALMKIALAPSTSTSQPSKRKILQVRDISSKKNIFKTKVYHECFTGRELVNAICTHLQIHENLSEKMASIFLARGWIRQKNHRKSHTKGFKNDTKFFYGFGSRKKRIVVVGNNNDPSSLLCLHELIQFYEQQLKNMQSQQEKKQKSNIIQTPFDIIYVSQNEGINFFQSFDKLKHTKFVNGMVKEINPYQWTIHVISPQFSSSTISYDHLVLCPGFRAAKTSFFIDEVSQPSCVYPYQDPYSLSHLKKAASIVIIGSGDKALETLFQALCEKRILRITLISSSKHLMDSPSLHSKLISILSKYHQVDIQLECAVQEIANNTVIYSNSAQQELEVKDADLIYLCTGKEANTEVDFKKIFSFGAGGEYKVNENMQIMTPDPENPYHSNIFAMGSCIASKPEEHFIQNFIHQAKIVSRYIQSNIQDLAPQALTKSRWRVVEKIQVLSFGSSLQVMLLGNKLLSENIEFCKNMKLYMDHKLKHQIEAMFNSM